MVAVKDAARESLIGQAGGIEPVYDQYATCFSCSIRPTGSSTFPSSWDRLLPHCSRKTSTAATSRWY
jgi:hypothetical protein